MCDDLTAIEEQRALDSRGIDRRRFAALGAAGLGALAAPLAAKAPAGLAERMVTLATPDGQLDADLALVGPGLLRKGAVDADPDDVGIEPGVLGQAGRDVAELLGADPGEGQREEQEDGVLGTKVGTELHVDQTGRGLGLEGEIRGGGSDSDRHSLYVFDGVEPTIASEA